MDPTVASFLGTLAYGRQVLWMLFIVNLVGWQMQGLPSCAWGVIAAIAATTAAYASQMLLTEDRIEIKRAGLWAMLASIMLGVVSGLTFLFAAVGG